MRYFLANHKTESPITDFNYRMGFNVTIEKEQEIKQMEKTMTLEERKFIIMARIAVLLGRQGYYCDVQQHPSGYTVLSKKIQNEDEPFAISHHEMIFSHTKTEEDLMQWWSELESDVK